MDPITCLAIAIFFEARDQNIEGKNAVAEVVMNRVEHQRFPDTVCDVVFDNKAFSFTHDGLSDEIEDYFDNPIDERAGNEAYLIAQEVYGGNRFVGITSTHYHTVSVNPFWAELFPKDGIVGDHIFYTCQGYC